MSNAAKFWMGQVAQLPCCCGCGKTPVQVHHITTVERGMGHKPPDTFVIPLSPECHASLHSMGTKAWERAFGEQTKHLAATIEAVAKRLMR